MKRVTMKRQRAILMVEPQWLRSGLRGVGVFIVAVVFAAGICLSAAGAQQAETEGGTGSENGPGNCLRCHAEKLKGYEHSAHGEAKVSCVKCHTVHAAGVKPGSEGQMLKVAEPKLCLGCHSEVEPEFQKASHHNLGENESATASGKIRCSDCHELHGAVETKSLKRAANEAQSCLKCHKELAGPYEFEHAPLKAEGCTICHFAHGGENPKLLKRTKVNELCTECHAPAVNIKGRVIQGHILNAQSAACTSCHVEIHGSHTSEVFFNTAQ
jgi:DmsE family decaheme c-type cytochrome